MAVGASPSVNSLSELLGGRMHDLASALYPICRSLTGDGVRETLRMIGQIIPLQIEEIPTGTQIYDWVAPKEWNIRDAYVKNDKGERVIDFQRHNLHVMGYSVPVRTRMPRNELAIHVHTLPEQPHLIPYRTSYYNADWAFCMAHSDWLQLPLGEYEVVIDASLENGSLTCGECILAGETSDEVLVHTHVCHPSMANDNVSGIVVATYLAQWLAQRYRRFTYRFLFMPGSIGALAWLNRNEAHVSRIRHGLVLTCLGDSGEFTYKRSRTPSQTDVVMEYLLRHTHRAHAVDDFSPYGYDERQYCSPGFDLPVGCLMRTPHGKFPEYHTSADDLTFLKPEALQDSLELLQGAVALMDANRTYLNLSPKGEPQLGKRGLYRMKAGAPSHEHMAFLWTLNLSDGRHTLLDIASRSGLEFSTILAAAEELERHQLLKQI